MQTCTRTLANTLHDLHRAVAHFTPALPHRPRHPTGQGKARARHRTQAASPQRMQRQASGTESIALCSEGRAARVRARLRESAGWRDAYHRHRTYDPIVYRPRRFLPKRRLLVSLPPPSPQPRPRFPVLHHILPRPPRSIGSATPHHSDTPSWMPFVPSCSPSSAAEAATQ